MKLIPIKDRLVVKRVFLQESSIIQTPENAKQSQICEVIAVGDCAEIPAIVKPGVKLLIGFYAGQPFQYKDLDLIVIRNDEIMAVIWEE
jgi:co-chaperonin GroES (HSP10)